MSYYGYITCLRCGGPVTVRCNCDLCEGWHAPSMMCACNGLVIDNRGALYVAGQVYFQGRGYCPEHLTRIVCRSVEKLMLKKMICSWGHGENGHV
jgi:hypothetical protein